MHPTHYYAFNLKCAVCTPMQLHKMVVVIYNTIVFCIHLILHVCMHFNYLKRSSNVYTFHLVSQWICLSFSKSLRWNIERRRTTGWKWRYIYTYIFRIDKSSKRKWHIMWIYIKYKFKVQYTRVTTTTSSVQWQT